MMRRTVVALLCFMQIAAPAMADRVAIIRQWNLPGNSGYNDPNRYLGMLKSVGDVLGVDYDVMDQRAVAAPLNSSTPGNANHVNQSAIRTGLVYHGWGAGSPTTQYGGMIHMSFIATNSGGAVGATNSRCGGYNPDTLTRYASWPEIPTAFFGPGAVSGGTIFSNTATCTTGFTGSAGALPDNAQKLAFHSPGYPWTFKSSGHVYYQNGASSIIKAAANGVVKTRLAVGTSASALHGNGTSSAQWPDSLAFAGLAPTYSSSPSADTAMILTRHKSTGADEVPLIFALPLYMTGGGVAAPALMFAMVYALMDSASGGRIIGQKQGWKPLKLAVVVDGAFTRSVSNSNSTQSDSHGLQCATQCDSALVKAGIDSLKALGIPITVLVNADSVVSYPYEKAWWNRIPSVRYGLSARGQAGSSANVNTGPASEFTSPDPFGYRRARQLGDRDVLAGTANCLGSDTSLVCLLKRARARLDSIPEFKGKVGRTLLASNSDYLASNFTRANAPGEDSLVAAMMRAGWHVGLNDAMFGDTKMVSGVNSSGGFAVTEAGAPNGYGLHERSVKSAFGLGKFRWLSFRGIDEDNTNNLAWASHDVSVQASIGTTHSPWFLNNSSGWSHEFKTRTSVICVKMGDLGFNANVATSNNIRPGYFVIKNIVNQVRIINAMAGRTVIHFGYPEEIEP